LLDGGVATLVMLLAMNSGIPQQRCKNRLLGVTGGT